MAKTYRRIDGFEVQDAKDRPIEWAVETYGGEETDWSEVIPPPPPTEEEVTAKMVAKEAKKQLVLEKLKITEEEFKSLLA